MNTCRTAVIAVVACLPVTGFGQEGTPVDDASADEIIVLGRSVTTASTRIDVQQKLLVDTAAALKDAPGADANSNGTITGIAQYRGMFGDRVTVALDGLGVVSGGPNAMDTPLSYVSPMITEQLTVERGIASVALSPESIGGYIDTKLARGGFGSREVDVSGMVGSRYASNQGTHVSAGRLTLANENQKASLVAEHDRAGDLSTPVGDMRPSRVDRRRYDLSYGYARDDSDFLLAIGRLDTTDTGTPALPMDIRYIDADLLAVRFGARLSRALLFDARVAYNDVAHLMDNFALRPAPVPMRRRQNLTHGSGLHFSLAGLLELPRSALRFGADGNTADHDSTIRNPDNPVFRVENFSAVERDLLSLFAEWNLMLGASALELGLRYKQVDADAGPVGAAGMPAPMLGTVLSLADAFNTAERRRSWNSVDAVMKYRRPISDSTAFVVEAGSKTRAPSYQELYLWLPLQATGGLADGRTYVGDIGLEQERSNEIVVGITTTVGRVSLSPQVFVRRVQDYIQGMPSTDPVANAVSGVMNGAPSLRFSNVDAEIRGADVAWKIDIGRGWFVDGIASYSRGKRTDTSDNLYRLAPPNGRIGLGYAAQTWTINPELVVYARQDKTSAYNGEQATPGYELVNVTFAWNPTPAVRIEARLDNAFDEAYQDHLAGINRAEGSDIPVGERLYGAGRTFSAGLVFRF